MRKTSIATLAALASLALLVLLLARCGDESPSSDTRGRIVSRGSARRLASSDSLAAYQRTRYELALDTETTLAMAGANEAKRRLHIDGELEDIVLASDDDTTTSLFVLSARDATSDGIPPETLEAALARGVIIERDRAGTLLRFRLHEATPPTIEPAIEHVLETLQVSRPPEPSTAAWTTAEPSVLGELHAEYRVRERGADRVTIEKRRVEGPHGASFDGALSAELSADATSLAALSGEQTFSIAIGGEPVAVRANGRTRIALSRRTQDAIELDADATRGFGPWTTFGDPVRAAERRRASAERLIRGRDFDALLAASVDGDREAFAALHELLMTRPETCLAAAKLLAARPPSDDKTSRLLVGALIAAKHDEAQAAVADVADAWREHDEHASMLIGALGILDAPSAATEAYLRERLDDVDKPRSAGAAAVGLGRLAGRVADDDPARAGELLELLLAKLAERPTGERLYAVLAGLANGADARIVEPVSPYLQDEDVIARKLAGTALVNVPGSAAEPVLARTVSVETNADVLGELLSRMAHRPTPPRIATALRERLDDPLPDSVLDLIRAALGRTE